MQNSPKIKPNRGLVLNSVFFLFAIVLLVNSEAQRHTSGGFHYYPNLITVELVLNPETNGVFPLPPHDLIPIVKISIQPDFSVLHKNFLLSFNNLVLTYLKSNDLNYNPSGQITSILQQCSIWHHPADEDGICISLS